MRTFKKFIGISIAVLCFTLTSYSQDKPKATYQVGNSEMDADLSNINLNAKYVYLVALNIFNFRHFKL